MWKRTSSRWRWPRSSRLIVEEEQPGLVLCGKQSIDNDMNATGQMLAALLGWAQGGLRIGSWKLEGDGEATVTREVDGGLQVDQGSRPPTVVTVDLRLNEPRYASLPNIMKAKKKPLDRKDPRRLRRGRDLRA